MQAVGCLFSNIWESLLSTDLLISHNPFLKQILPFLFLNKKLDSPREATLTFFWDEAWGQDQSQGLVISDFISGLQRSLIVNKGQLYWHLWHCTGLPRTHVLCPLRERDCLRVWEEYANTKKVTNLWKAMTSKHWSMASIGLKYSVVIDSIGDIVTGDLQTCWKCQEGTHAQVENRQFYRICVSHTAGLDSDGRSHWPHRVDAHLSVWDRFKVQTGGILYYGE